MNDIIRMARESGLELYPGWVTDGEGLENLERFAALVAAAEREECAKKCDIVADIAAREQDFYAISAAEECAELIRARGR